jgi:hypothetical protein
MVGSFPTEHQNRLMRYRPGDFIVVWVWLNHDGRDRPIIVWLDAAHPNHLDSASSKVLDGFSQIKTILTKSKPAHYTLPN